MQAIVYIPTELDFNEITYLFRRIVRYGSIVGFERSPESDLHPRVPFQPVAFLRCVAPLSCCRYPFTQQKMRVSGKNLLEISSKLKDQATFALV